MSYPELEMCILEVGAFLLHVQPISQVPPPDVPACGALGMMFMGLSTPQQEHKAGQGGVTGSDEQSRHSLQLVAPLILMRLFFFNL